METVISSDIKKIESIKLNYPELMSDNAENLISSLIENIWNIEDNIQYLREDIRVLESTLEKKKEELRTLSPLFEVTYAKVEKRVKTNTSTIMIKGHGNSIIGVTNKV